MPDSLFVAYTNADLATSQWELQEAHREELSEAQDRDRELLARFPHKAQPEMPGFCRCGWRLDHTIHDRR